MSEDINEKTIEKSDSATKNVDDSKEEEDYVIVHHEDAEIKESIENEVPLQNSISQSDKGDAQKTEELYETDFFESDHDDVREEERPGEEDAKTSLHEIPAETTEKPAADRPVVEITAEFLELLEGFCMAISQEFPSDIVDFACRYFQRIHRRRNALRKYSIEVSDLALFSDVNWVGNI